MSSVNKLSVLAFASTVLATPFAGQHHGHQHVHRGLKGYSAPSYTAPYPYPSANTTSVWGTTGVASSSSSASSSAVTPPGYSSGHDTLTSTLFQTVYSTVSVSYQSSSASPAGYGSGSGTGSGSSGSGEQCAADVTVTSTEKVYVTVTAGQTPGSSESSPVETSSVKPTSTIHITQTVTPSASAPAYTAPSSSSSSPAAPVSSSSSAPAYSAPSSSSESSPNSYSTPAASSSSESSSSAFPVLTAYTEAKKEVAAATSSSSAPASYTSSASTSGGKRGLAYNTASLLTCFDDSSEISWAYNWVSASAGLTGGLKFVPTLHDGSDTFTSVWSSEASASIASGSTTLFSFNEPDESSQANMTPEAAAEAYIKYMNPFAGKAQLCAPSVTNGGGEMGLTWLSNFIDACAGNCHIDCYNIHWYSPADSDGFKTHVEDAIKIAGDKAVWVSEYGCTGSTDDEVNSFLEEVMPWMDSNDSIAGYAYFMAADGTLMSGTEPSTYGKTYMSYTG